MPRHSLPARLALVVLAWNSIASLRAESIRPLIVSETSEQATPAPVIDRSDARELARLAFPPRTPRFHPSLQHEGDVETLATPLVLGGNRMVLKSAGIQTIGKIDVEGASTIRLHLPDAPEGTILWLAGSEDEEFTRFEPSRTATWSPTTRGSEVVIAAEQMDADVRITKLSIGRIAASSAPVCAKDAMCAEETFGDEIDVASRAIALIRFVRGDASYACTGGLINDGRNSRTPFFLTAQHCISTPEEAASIEAVWNLRSESCGSSRVAVVSKTYGADLLVASRETDLALLRLRKTPANPVFLGINSTALQPGTPTYRLSHAGASVQTYSKGAVQEGGMSCPTAPRPQFLYTKLTSGAIATGSSGAPLLVPGLTVVGQLFGRCGPSPNDACATFNEAVDGWIGASWALLAPHLQPSGSPRARAPRS